MTRSELMDRGLTALTIVAAVAFVVVASERYFGDSRAGRRPTLAVGDTVGLPDVDWSRADHTLILALQPDCPYCVASAPFYQQLLVATTSKTRIIVVTPFSKPTGEQMLKDYALPSTEVIQGDFAQLKISGTPTILLVDRAGRLQQAWIGQLSQAYQDAVRKAIGLAPLSIGAAETERSSASASAALFLLDARERVEFSDVHLANAVNIPLDELEIRAPHELPRGKLIGLICTSSRTCPIARDADSLSPTRCDVEREFLRREGFVNVRVLDEIERDVGTGGVTRVGGAS